MKHDPKRVLVIDDDPSSAEFTQAVLEAEDYVILRSETGKDGLYKALSEKPDLIIVDILLPGLNGLEVIKQLRSDPRSMKIPLLLLSSVYIPEDEIEKGLQIGTTQYHLDVESCMAKPIDQKKLVEQVKILLGEIQKPEADEKAKILIIDDDPDVIELLKIRLEPKYMVLAAFSGEEGLKKAKDFLPNVVFQDIMLPGMDGLEVLQRLKQEMPEVAVIIITAHGNEEIAGEALRRGANDYISKPIDYRKIEVRVQENLIKNQLQLRNRELVEQLRASNVRLMQRYIDVDQIVMNQAQKLVKYEQMLFEKERLEEKQRFEGVLGSLMDGVIVTDPYSRVLLINPQAEEWFDICAGDVIGQELPYQIKDRELRNLLEAALIRHEHGYWFDFEWVTPQDQRKRMLRARLTTIYRGGWEETAETLLGLVLTFSDVTQQMEAIRELEFRSVLLEKIIEVVISTDMEGTIRTWNRAAETVFGYSPAEILGENIEILIPAEEFPEVWQRIITTTREGRMFKEEIAIINKNRVRQKLQLATSLINNSKDKSNRLLFVAECVLPPQSGDYA